MGNPLPFRDNTFNAVSSVLVLNYLPGGWENPLIEHCRVLEPGGYLYLSVFLKEWDYSFIKTLKMGLQDLFHDPIGIFYGIRSRAIAHRITKEGNKLGSAHPPKDKLLESLTDLGFTEITTIPIYWGFGLALRAKKPL